MKIALVHDFLMYWGGAERVLRGFHTMFPKAPIYTLFYDKPFAKRFFPDADIRPSFLQSSSRFGHRWLLPLMPSAAESLNLDSFDTVISSGIFSKGIITKPFTRHIHYCHTPPRFLWEESEEYLDSAVSFPLRSLASLSLHLLRIWDKAASDRVDTFLANSRWTAARIKKIYGKDAKVIYPFVDLEKAIAKNLKLKTKNYFLIVSRLKSYKNIDLAIKVFNKTGLRLYIVGEGSERRRLQGMAKRNIKFLGMKQEEHLPLLYRHASAVILPGQEDFGLTIVEAMAQGTPVLAWRKGGAQETIVEGTSGEFFDEPTPKSFYAGLRRLAGNLPRYRKVSIEKSAQKFSFQRFQREIGNAIKP